MKKTLIFILVCFLLIPSIAAAEKASLIDFTIVIPDNYSISPRLTPEHREYNGTCETNEVKLVIDLLDFAFSSSIEELAKKRYDNHYSIQEIGKLQMAICEPESNNKLISFFVLGNHCYQIKYTVTGKLQDENYNEWNSLLQSITISSSVELEDTEHMSIENDAPEPPKTTDEADMVPIFNVDTSNYTTLEKGSKGEEVKALQQRLIDLLYLTGSADGDYGNKTKAAVEGFQKKAGIMPVTGIADGITQAMLFADDAPEAELSVSCSVAGINNYYTAYWNVNGQEFTLKGNQTKTLDTPWGKYKFDASGEYEKID